MTNEETARVFKAFCDESRIKILKLLVGGEKCACVLLEELDISQPTLSHHMKILTESGIVVSRRAGKWIHYRINNEEGVKVVELLHTLTADQSEGNNNKCLRI